jgi:hypothetical protein
MPVLLMRELVMGILREVGVIAILSSAVLGITGGDPWAIFLSTIWLSAIKSGLVDNIPFTVTMVPAEGSNPLHHSYSNRRHGVTDRLYSDIIRCQILTNYGIFCLGAY